jgi:hypothetical protein
MNVPTQMLSFVTTALRKRRAASRTRWRVLSSY